MADRALVSGYRLATASSGSRAFRRNAVGHENVGSTRLMQNAARLVQLSCAAIVAFVTLPALLILKIAFVVGRQCFDLLLRKIGKVFVFFVAARANALRSNEKMLACEPSASVDHDVPELASGVIEDYVVDLAELLVIASIQSSTADVVSLIVKAEIAQSPQMSHTRAPERS